jgi:hypothetical protein
LHFAKVELREGLKELSLAKPPLVGEKVGDFFSNVPWLGLPLRHFKTEHDKYKQISIY